jgi:glycosyltransferase involved in cell wall biosynthesis
MKLIVQIPCFNEAESLARVIYDIPSVIDGIDVIETLVIDDGSRDATALVAKSAGVNYIVRHDRNLGLAAAFMTGIGACLEHSADIVVNTDGDHQYPGHYIRDLVRPILDARADIVIGDRQPVRDSRLGVMKRFWHLAGSTAIGILCGQRLADPVSGFRAYSKQAALDCSVCNTFSYTIESLMRAAYTRTRIEFVKIETNATIRPSRLFRSDIQFVRRSAMVALGVAFQQRAILWRTLMKRVLT